MPPSTPPGTANRRLRCAPAPTSADATAVARAIRRVLAETLDPQTTEMTLGEMLDALLKIFNDEELNALLACIEKSGGNGRDPPLE